MQDVVWNKIYESGNGHHKSFYARVINGFLIKEIEKTNVHEEKETINFFALASSFVVDWEFEEL
jgi:hypothetical protein